jgi:hypothetical protein
MACLGPVMDRSHSGLTLHQFFRASGGGSAGPSPGYLPASLFAGLEAGRASFLL